MFLSKLFKSWTKKSNTMMQRPNRARGAAGAQINPMVEALEQRNLFAISVTKFPIERYGASPMSIVSGPQGCLWFTEDYSNYIGRITTDGVITEFPFTQSRLGAEEIIVGPDGNLWFTVGDSILRQMTPTGDVTVIATSLRHIDYLTVGPDGNMWFSGGDGKRIGRVSLGGDASYYDVPGRVVQLTGGPDGNVWFTEGFSTDKIGQISPIGVVTEYSLPQTGKGTSGITKGADGNLWFTAYDVVGRITPNGAVTEFRLAPDRTLDGPIITGAHGQLFFAEISKTSHYIGTITESGMVSEYRLPRIISGPVIPTYGPDGNIWAANALSDLFRVSLDDPSLEVSKIGQGPDLNTIAAQYTPRNSHIDTTEVRVAIDWGDGVRSEGSIVDNGVLQIRGAHRYAQAGSFTLTVDLVLQSQSAGSVASGVVAIYTPTQVYVNQLYRDLLHRESDPAGMQFWTRQLESGVSRKDVASAIESSPESRTRAVEALYATLLHRKADGAGLAAFVNFTGHGGSLMEVKAAILGSEEFFASQISLHATGSQLSGPMQAAARVQEFLDVVYEDVLGRSLDESGRATWSALLLSGKSRQAVAQRILKSAEALDGALQQDYQLLLHRSVDENGRRAFDAVLQKGARSEEILASIAASDEYYARYAS